MPRVSPTFPANRNVLTEGMSLIEVVRVNAAAARFLEVDDPRDLEGPLRPETFPDDSLPSMVAQLNAIWNDEDHVTVEVRHGYTLQGNPLYGLLHWAAPRRFGKLDLSKASVVTLYLLPEMNERLIPQLRKMKRGSRIVTHDFPIAGFEHETRVTITSTDDDAPHTIYLYTWPWD